jgi:DNA-binding NarL/FixJ family response regulator
MATTASVARVPAALKSDVVTVLGGDTIMRRDIVRRLAAADFGVRTELGDDALVVVLVHRREDIRLRQIRKLADTLPGARILVIVPREVTNAGLRRVLLAGAAGILLEGDVERALVPTARSVLAGQLTVPSVLGQKLAPRPLSHREKEILALVVIGKTNREIAHTLFLAESTVKTHLSSAFRKIDARSRAEAVARIQDPELDFGPGVLAVVDALAS